MRAGKLIVAAADQVGAQALATRGHANGVTDLEVVERAFVRRREPHVEAAAATWSPSTGILEAEAYVRALARVAAAREVALLPGAGAGVDGAVDGGVARPDGEWRSGPRAIELGRRGPVRRRSLRRARGETFTIHPVRGDYAELAPAARHLVNGAAPTRGHGLGVHLTRTTWGSVTLGPTARTRRQGRLESDRDRSPGSTPPPGGCCPTSSCIRPGGRHPPGALAEHPRTPDPARGGNPDS